MFKGAAMLKDRKLSIKSIVALGMLSFIAFRVWTAQGPVPAAPTVTVAQGSPLTASLQWSGNLLYLPNSIRYLAFSADGRFIVAVCWDQLALWDAATGRNVWSVHLTEESQERILSIALCPDGRYLAVAGWDARVEVWELATGSHRATLSGTTRRTDKDHSFGHDWHAMAFSPDSKTLATALEDETVKLWDVATFQEKASLKAHRLPLCMVAFSPDGMTLASVANKVSFDPDGEIAPVAIDEQQSEIKLWDLSAGRERATLANPLLVYSLAFSPDGLTLATGGDADVIKLWDVASGNIKRSLPLKKPGSLRWSSPTELWFSPDNNLLASIGNDSDQKWGEPNDVYKITVALKFWDPRTGEERFGVKRRGVVYAAALSPDWKTLALFAEGPDQTDQLSQSLFKGPRHVVPLWRLDIRPVAE
jgi:WD40 repeat protein